LLLSGNPNSCDRNPPRNERGDTVFKFLFKMSIKNLKFKISPKKRISFVPSTYF